MNIYERVEHRMMNKTKNRSSRATNPLTSPPTTSQRLHHASTMLPYMNNTTLERRTYTRLRRDQAISKRNIRSSAETGAVTRLNQ